MHKGMKNEKGFINAFGDFIFIPLWVRISP